MNELGAWVRASLAWDATRDTDDLVAEFLRGYYGPSAAPYVMQHMAVWKHATTTDRTALVSCCVCKNGSNYSSFRPSKCQDMPWISANATLYSAVALLAARSAASSEDGPYRARVDRIFLQMRYIILARWEEICDFAQVNNLTWPLATRASTALAEFVVATSTHGVMQLGESADFNVSSFVASVNHEMLCEQ